MMEYPLQMIQQGASQDPMPLAGIIAQLSHIKFSRVPSRAPTPHSIPGEYVPEAEQEAEEHTITVAPPTATSKSKSKAPKYVK